MKNSIFQSFFPMWTECQFGLSKVTRWEQYLSDGYGKDMVPQSTLHHTLSFSLFGSMAMSLLDPYIVESCGKPLDRGVLLLAFQIHDLGEGLTKRDVLAHLKQSSHDLEEYHAFMENIKYFPRAARDEFQYAFLLQFADGDTSIFPDNECRILQKINYNHRYEALTFKALEKLEYLFYPLWMEDNHPHLATWVMRNQLESYRNFASKLPGFRQVLFTCEMENWIMDYLKRNEDVPDQKTSTVNNPASVS